MAEGAKDKETPITAAVGNAEKPGPSAAHVTAYASIAVALIGSVTTVSVAVINRPHAEPVPSTVTPPGNAPVSPSVPPSSVASVAVSAAPLPSAITSAIQQTVPEITLVPATHASAQPASSVLVSDVSPRASTLTKTLAKRTSVPAAEPPPHSSVSEPIFRAPLAPVDITMLGGSTGNASTPVPQTTPDDPDRYTRYLNGKTGFSGTDLMSVSAKCSPGTHPICGTISRNCIVFSLNFACVGG